MQVNPFAIADKAGESSQRIVEPLGHGVRAAILDLRADEFHFAQAARLSKLALAQSVERQVFVILEIVDGGHAELRLEPSDVLRAGKFANQQAGRNFGD